MLDTDTLVHFSDPFDGFNRNHYLTPFTAALLASVGIPSVITGTHSVGPKYGINTHILLKTAAKNPLLSVSDVQNQIQTPSIGWGYCDQSQYNPPMEALTSLRQNMVKRPLLATIDKLILPFTAPTTLVVAGYTHPPYKAKLARLLEVHPASPKGLILRGIEGSTQLPTGKRAPATPLGSEETLFSRPEDFGLTPIDNHTNPDITASETISEGITALKGVHGGAKATILYNALGIIKALGKFNQSTLGQLTKNLTNGSAVSHWELGHQ